MGSRCSEELSEMVPYAIPLPRTSASEQCKSIVPGSTAFVHSAFLKNHLPHTIRLQIELSSTLFPERYNLQMYFFERGLAMSLELPTAISDGVHLPSD